MGDVISLAGKIAVEAAFPCIQVPWSFGRGVCTTAKTETAQGPSGAINSFAGYQPFLNRYNLTANEMGVLISGSHGIAGSQANVSDSGFGTFFFSSVTSGVGWIKRSIGGWKLENSAAGNLQFTGNDPHSSNNAIVGRMPSDMVFFPTTLQAIKSKAPSNTKNSPPFNSIVVDMAMKSVEKYLTSFTSQTEAVFNAEFVRVYAKMLSIGSSQSLTPFVDPYTLQGCQKVPSSGGQVVGGRGTPPQAGGNHH